MKELDALIVTKEALTETTLLCLLNVTCASTFANGIPS